MKKNKKNKKSDELLDIIDAFVIGGFIGITAVGILSHPKMLKQFCEGLDIHKPLTDYTLEDLYNLLRIELEVNNIEQANKLIKVIESKIL